MKNNKDFVRILIKEINQSYEKSGLEKPEKADLNKDKKISSYEKKRGAAVEKNVDEGHEGQDHEVSMANNSIESIIWAANELKKHLQGGERDIPAWIQDHITNAENYIVQAAKNYHEYGSEEGEEEDYEEDEYDGEDYESEEEFEEPTDSEEDEEYSDEEDMDYEEEYEEDLMEAKGHKVKKMKKETKTPKKKIKERRKK